jgi:hypothetical protein
MDSPLLCGRLVWVGDSRMKRAAPPSPYEISVVPHNQIHIHFFCFKTVNRNVGYHFERSRSVTER